MVRARPHIHRHKNPANWARLLHKSTTAARHSPLLGVSTTRDTFRPGPVSYLSRARLPIDNAGACWHYISQAPLLPHWGATYQVVAPRGAFCGLEATRPLRVYYQGHRFLVLKLSPALPRYECERAQDTTGVKALSLGTEHIPDGAARRATAAPVESGP